jgi:hypothetical protein
MDNDSTPEIPDFRRDPNWTLLPLDISMNYDFYPWHVWHNRQTKCVILTRRQSKNGLWALSKSLVDHYMKALAEGLQVTVLLMTPDDRIVGQYDLQTVAANVKGVPWLKSNKVNPRFVRFGKNFKPVDARPCDLPL